MITYPNQKIIHINKETTTNFLQVDKDAWMNASNELNYGTFKMYLYLAGNQDDFDLALSPVAVKEKLGISKNTYHRAIEELIEKNYLVLKQGNIYDFYVYPQEGIYPSMGTLPTHTWVHDIPTDGYMTYPSTGTEIDKRDKRDIFYINESEQSSSSLGANAPAATLPEEREKKRTLEELSNEELKSLRDDFEAEVQYKDLYPKYNIRKGQLDKNLCTKIDNILSDRQQNEQKEKIREYLKEDEYSSNELKKLMHLTDEELLDFLSSLDEIIEPFEVVCFFEEHSVFTYEEFLHEDTKLTYFEWFKMGMTNNFKRW